MSRMTALVTAALLLAGCTNPATTVRIVAKDTTVAALTVADATKADAAKIEMLAISVRESIEDGVLDVQALKAQILAAIADQFSGNKEIILLLLVDDIITLVLGEVDPTFPPSEVFVLMDAAAEGVAQGAVFYGALAERGAVIIKLKTE